MTSPPFDNVVMIVGAPRSGTSWVGKIFDSHPNVLYRHEPDTVLPESRLPFIIRTDDSARYVEIAAAYLDRLLRVSTIKSSAQVPLFPKNYRSRAMQPLYGAMVHSARLFAKVLATPRVGAVALPNLFDLDQHPELQLILKTVTALGRIEVFLRAAPMLRVVFLLRHPGGQVASMLRGMRLGRMEQRDAFIKDVARTPAAARYGLTLQSLAKSSDIEQWTWNWVAMNEFAMEALSNRGHGRTLIMTYEDVCSDPVRQGKALFRFANLDWNRQTEDFIKQSIQGGRTERYYSVFRNVATAANKWRSELAGCDQQTITNILQQTMLAGYWPNVSEPIGCFER
ncbi:MAG: sulfotransferase [Rhodospirillales bacterium]|nr:sulfotransferase [Rhodospirillales bacterium]